ncbi:RTA1 like protein [Serendipita vermifera]|nr:RTA1 like protein [Serendipita vermifera]
MSATPTTTAVPHEGISPYGYIPTEAVCIVFVTLFGLSAFLHTVQAIKWRTWWMLPTMALGCMGEVIGWSGRLWSSRNPRLLDPFLMQISSTIISPSFMSAANFTILGFIIRRLGAHYSRLSPRWYLIIFITLDLASLIVQAIGGARASSAAQRNEDAEVGGRIMLYGIITQMIALTIYVALGTEFVIRYTLHKPVRKPTVADLAATASADPSYDSYTNEKTLRPVLDRNTKLMLVGLIINTVFLFIRAIYRTIELNDGWSGAIITNQALFNWLDGMPITVCTYTFNILHPGYLLLATPVVLGSSV